MIFQLFPCFTSWLSRTIWCIRSKTNSFSFLCFLFLDSPYFFLLLCGLLVLGEVFVCFLIFSISFLVNAFLNNLGMLYHSFFAFLCIRCLSHLIGKQENIYWQLFCQDFHRSRTTFQIKHNQVYLHLHFYINLVNSEWKCIKKSIVYLQILLKFFSDEILSSSSQEQEKWKSLSLWTSHGSYQVGL